jgi:hypothetical protein
MFGQPGFPGQPGMFRQPGFTGRPGFAGRPGFGGLGPRSSRPSRAPVTGPGLVVAAIGAIIALIIFGVIASHMSSGSPFGQDPSGSCLGGPAPGAVGQPIGNGNVRFQCVDGGSTVVHVGNP